jgi:tetratricopeptide (TPR) repeat protein
MRSEPASGRMVALRLLRAHVPSEIMDAPDGWPRWAVLLPHVLAATGHANARSDPDVMATVSWLMDRAACYLQVQARLSEAKHVQERSLAIAETVHGRNHSDVANRLNLLAGILRELGQREEARPLQERALVIKEATYGPDHPDVARALGNLAKILRELGQSEAARAKEERAQAIKQQSARFWADREEPSERA